MALTDLLLYATAAVFPLLLAIEHLIPARWQPKLPAWRTLGIGFFALYAAIAYFLPQALPAAWFEASLLPGAALGVAGGTVVGYLAVTLVGYGWHRAAHASSTLWRLFHQMHHSPRRLDVASSLVFHPSEMVFYTLMPLVVTTLVLGIDPVAAGIVGLLGVFNGVFQHANIATPRWLTWFMQRPEAHSIHHSVHAHNYSDFPLWDRLFGTYREGVGFRPQVGFATAQSKRWWAMAFFADVHAVDAGTAQEAQVTLAAKGAAR
jgi:sterol desaturase/sphingolipid hydroxylase (fatty acid hydroxylase superfamily)